MPSREVIQQQLREYDSLCEYSPYREIKTFDNTSQKVSISSISIIEYVTERILQMNTLRRTQFRNKYKTNLNPIGSFTFSQQIREACEEIVATKRKILIESIKNNTEAYLESLDKLPEEMMDAFTKIMEDKTKHIVERARIILFNLNIINLRSVGFYGEMETPEGDLIGLKKKVSDTYTPSEKTQ